MNIRLFATIEEAERYDLSRSTAVVIDVLRFSSAVVAALEAGASEIIPVEDIETATRLVDGGKRKTKLLAGEQKGLPIEGFDLFNSPTEFTREVVGGKTLVMTTSNGSRGILLASRAARTVVCSIINLSGVADALSGEDHVSIICCGSEGMLALEDLYCGGLLMRKLGVEAGSDEPNDSGRLALLLSRDGGRDTLGSLSMSDRGRELEKAGYHKDVVYCSKSDSSSIVPVLEEGALRPLHSSTKEAP